MDLAIGVLGTDQGLKPADRAVAGIMLGAGIGYGLDWLFGTLPMMLILFVLLGFVAGIKVMMRTAAELGSTSGKTPGTDERD